MTPLSDGSTPSNNEIDSEWQQLMADPEKMTRSQINVRLTPTQSKMIRELREYLVEQKDVTFLHKTDRGSEIADSDTKLGRFLLETALESLYAELENEIQIEAVAKLFAEGKKDVNQIRNIASCTIGVPKRLVEYVLAVARHRADEIKAGSPIENGLRVRDAAFHKKYGHFLKKTEEGRQIRRDIAQNSEHIWLMEAAPYGPSPEVWEEYKDVFEEKDSLEDEEV